MRSRGEPDRQGHVRVYNWRDDGNVPVICPTCQNVFSGEISMPATPLFSRGSFLCMGLFSMFLVWRAPGRPFGFPISPHDELSCSETHHLAAPHMAALQIANSRLALSADDLSALAQRAKADPTGRGVLDPPLSRRMTVRGGRFLPETARFGPNRMLNESVMARNETALIRPK